MNDSRQTHAARHTAEWAAIIQSARADKGQIQAFHHAMADSVMARIANTVSEPVRPSHSHARPWTVSGLALAASLVLFASYAWQHGRSMESRPTDMAAHNAQVYYLSFDQGGNGEGTSSQPFSSLAQGLSSATDHALLKIESGSTSEKITISQPITLVAHRGPVRIGASD